MTELLLAVVAMTEGWEHLFLVFVRVGAFTTMLPAFGERSVSPRVKLSIAIVFTAIVGPVVSTPPPDNISFSIITEILTGLIFGISVRLFLLALQTAGSIAAQSTSLSQLLGNSGADPLPAMGYLLVVGGLALAVLSGLHIKAAEFLILTYDLVPLATLPAPAVFSEWGISQVARAFSLAFALAMPFVILSVIYNLALGAINKAMPQLMVAFVGAPLITAGGLIVFCIASPIMLKTWMLALDQFLAAPTLGVN